MTRMQETLYVGVKIFLALSAIAFVGTLVYSGFAVSDKNDACTEKGGVLVKTDVSGYICIDRSALK